MKVHEQHKNNGPEIVNIALVIVSTSRYNEKKSGEIKTDKTIPLINQILEEYPKYSLVMTDVVADSEVQIKNIFNKLIEASTNHAIIFSGGTGLTPKDITYETIEPMLEKKMDGFGELFRYLSFKEIGPASMLSRATAGKIKDKAVFLLPGSPNAVKLALKELILPELGHIIYSINKKE
ncbi:MAG: molybdenum cofactor biosynthesis protein B [Promethearchaeota archaeon]